MAGPPADQSGSFVASHKSYDPRVILFYFIIALLLAVLAGGLAFQQLFKTDSYHERERMQSHRRILVPGPRGNIYDRSGHLLVGNRPRFSVVLYLDELRSEFRREYKDIRKNYRDSDDDESPNSRQIEQLARTSVVQRYLDQVNDILRRNERVDVRTLSRHFAGELLLPYTLIDDLTPEEYARLLESLPVRSPLQVYTSSTRYYPYGSAAAHTLGWVGIDPDFEAQDFPGDDLTTFKMKGFIGKSGLEERFDTQLQGEPGGTIFRVDPAGYKINPPLERRLPVQGKNLTTSIDIDLQVAAEAAMTKTEMAGAAIALDVATGEVLVVASKPDYNLNDFAPRLSAAKAAEINASGAWYHRAIQGVYPPGSSFKLVTGIAALRAGVIAADSTVDCPGYYQVGSRRFPCHDGKAHGVIDFATAIKKSCNVFFYKYGLDLGPDLLAAEARRFHLDRPTGIELAHETNRMLIPDPAWKERTIKEPWYPGNTANYAIGQGFMGVTPLGMASFIASLARGQTVTPPTLLHVANHPALRTEPIGLSAENYAALLHGMEEVTTTGGTAGRILSGTLRDMPKLPFRIAGKTGTAQKRVEGGRNINFAWFVCFAPIERPEIAIAIAIEGDTPGEEVGGGIYAVPVAYSILSKWWEKKNATPSPLSPFKAPATP